MEETFEQIILNGQAFDVIGTWTDKKRDRFQVTLAEPGDDDSDFNLVLYLDEIYNDLARSEYCEGFEDCNDSRGEHTTRDFIIDPVPVFDQFSQAEQLDFVKEDLERALTRHNQKNHKEVLS